MGRPRTRKNILIIVDYELTPEQIRDLKDKYKARRIEGITVSNRQSLNNREFEPVVKECVNYDIVVLQGDSFMAHQLIHLVQQNESTEKPLFLYPVINVKENTTYSMTRVPTIIKKIIHQEFVPY